MKREEKVKFVQDFKDELRDMGILVVACYKGLPVSQIKSLRVSMRHSKAYIRVAKNRLVKIAVEGTAFEGVTPYLKGQTIMGYSQDPISAPKTMVQFSEENPEFEIIGGIMGENVLSAQSVQDLAKLPSLDELRGHLVRLVQAPLSKLMVMLRTPAERLAQVTGAYARKDEA